MSSEVFVDVEVISDEDDDWDIIKFDHNVIQNPIRDNKITSFIEIIDSDSDTISAPEIEETLEAKTSPKKETAVINKESTSLSVSFFDLPRNKILLKQCCALTINIVDCNKFPWYYKRYKTVENMFPPKSKPKIRPVDISTYAKSNLKLNSSKIINTESNKKAQIDFKNNQGLVGLKICSYNKNIDNIGFNVSQKSEKIKCKETDSSNKSKLLFSNSIKNAINSSLLEHDFVSVQNTIDLNVIEKNLLKSLSTADSKLKESVSDTQYKNITNLGKNLKKTIEMFDKTKKVLLNKVSSKAKVTNQKLDHLSSKNSLTAKACNPNKTSSNITNKITRLDSGNLLTETNHVDLLKTNYEILKSKQNNDIVCLIKNTPGSKLLLGKKLKKKTRSKHIKNNDEVSEKNNTFESKKQVGHKIPLLDNNINNNKNHILSDKKSDIISLQTHNATIQKNNVIKRIKKKKNIDKVKKSKPKIKAQNLISSDNFKPNEEHIRVCQNKSIISLSPDKTCENKNSNPLFNKIIKNNKKQTSKIKSQNNTNTILNRNNAEPIKSDTTKQKIKTNKIIKVLHKDLVFETKENNQSDKNDKILLDTKTLIQTTQSLHIPNSKADTEGANNNISWLNYSTNSNSNVELLKPFNTPATDINKNGKVLNCDNLISQETMNLPPVVVTITNQIVQVAKINNTTCNVQPNLNTDTKSTHGLIKKLSANFREINGPSTTIPNLEDRGQPIETHISRINQDKRMLPPTARDHNVKIICENKHKNSPSFNTKTELNNISAYKTGYFNHDATQNPHLNHPVPNNSSIPPRYPVMQAILNNNPNSMQYQNQPNFHRARPYYNFPLPTPRPVPPPGPFPPPIYPSSHQAQPLRLFRPPLPPLTNCRPCAYPSTFIRPPIRPQSIDPNNASSSPQMFPQLYQLLPPPYPPPPNGFQPPHTPFPTGLQPPPPPPPPDSVPLPPIPSPSSTSLPTRSLSSEPSITRNLKPSTFTITCPQKKNPQNTLFHSMPLSNSLSVTASTVLPITPTATLHNSFPFTPSHTPLTVPAPANVSHAPSNRLEGNTIIGQNQDGFIRTIAIPKLTTNPLTTNISPKRNQSIKPLNSGYSPPILPIRTYQEYFDMLTDNEKRIRYTDTKDMTEEQPAINSNIESNREDKNRKRKISPTKSDEKFKKKIPSDIYKERILNDYSNKENDVKIKIEPETEIIQSKNCLDLDLGYNSDSNSKQT